MEDEILKQRTRFVKSGSSSKGNVVYWMSRDQRAEYNWALIYALQLALEKQMGLYVVFCLAPGFLHATIRQYAFMVKGLQKVESKLRERNIPFFLLEGNPVSAIPEFCSKNKVSCLVTDFDPLRLKRVWLQGVCDKVTASVIMVDAHNIIPAFKVSEKAEYGAYTIRPKINKLLPIFLNKFPELPRQKFNGLYFQEHNWKGILDRLDVDRVVKEVEWCIAGEDEARNVLQDFLENKLENYPAQRNNPVSEGTSGLSPYLHFGHIPAQLVAMEVLKLDVNPASSGVFLEELIVRRELAENFCFYNPNYDSFEGFPAWAINSLNSHRADEREFTYDAAQFENAQTHDLLWNAAQKQMINFGKMNGYLRMYWAKKILEWSHSPEQAMQTAVMLNDKYQLDGRDPNGYTGCSWAIGGVHDRAWNKHPVYGMIRYMNYNGCKRKFDVNAYIRKFL